MIDTRLDLYPATTFPNGWRGLIHRYADYLPVTEHTPIVTLHEGNTPLIPAIALSQRLGRNIKVLLKYDGLNPTGSFKDRGMTMAISKAKEAGSAAVICASTGNTSAAAAAYAKRGGLKAFVLIPDGKIALGKLSQALIYGAEVIAIDGNFDQALEIVRELSEKFPITLVNSVNPYRLEGQKTAAFELVESMGDAPDWLCIPMGNAGNIIIGLRGDLQAENADISTFSRSGGGGSITIQARQVDLRQDSDVTSVVLSGAENAGNIVFVADFVFAFDDSDILASAVGGEGGDIDFSRTQGLFAENYVPGSLPPFEGNDRVDINATGGIASGDITFPDTSFIENSLTNLADVVIDTAALTAGSCIARTDESLGSFTVTGSGGLPQRPGDSAISAYPTGTVQTLATPTATHTLLEPDGVYQLPDGRLVLSRACEEG